MVSVLALTVTSLDNSAENAEDTVLSAVLGVVPSASAQPANTDIITMTRAMEISLDHAGLAENDVIFIEAELHRDDDRLEYEIEFYSGDTEYEYDIDATTGAVIERSTESTDDSIDTEIITMTRAMEISLDHAGITETDVTFVEVELHRDDGGLEYEIEFYSGDTEYEYDIDAVTGTIIEWEQDDD
ncbi:PepSY domain-containing protein [Methanosarcina hadiensis]|uniref:PepSY domain-containing protein n=1 Tax=Methanosarcina hadiensis TaxID=3078083 RepID=UPI003977B904